MFLLGSYRLEPQFTLLEDKSSDGAPRIQIEFPDKYKDTLVLEKFYGNEEDRKANINWCHYIGRLENEPESGVAMTGCIGNEDVELTILSTHSRACQMFRWTTEGKVEMIKCWPRVRFIYLVMDFLIHDLVNVVKIACKVKIS